MLNVQVQTASSYDILNNGQGLQWVDFSLLNSTYFENSLFSNQNIYPILFTTNVKRSLCGDQSSGYWQFDGSNYQLVLNPGSSFNSEWTSTSIIFAVLRSLMVVL